MSLRSLSIRAAQRDVPDIAAAAPTPTSSAPPPPSPGAPGAALPGPGAPTATPPPAGGPDLSSATGVLIDAIPSEVLAPYTALVGIVASTASAHEALRWWLFGVAAALIPTSLIITYYRNRTAPHRRVPLAEILSALFAFAAWGLVMPGSPLSLDISGDDLTIATAILAIGGAFLVTLLVPSLNKKSKAAGA